MQYFWKRIYYNNGNYHVLPDRECKLQWKHIKEKFRRELKSLESRSEDAAKSRKSWPLLNLLSFIRDQVKPMKHVLECVLKTDEAVIEKKSFAICVEVI